MKLRAENEVQTTGEELLWPSQTALSEPDKVCQLSQLGPRDSKILIWLTSYHRVRDADNFDYHLSQLQKFTSRLVNFPPLESRPENSDAVICKEVLLSRCQSRHIAAWCYFRLRHDQTLTVSTNTRRKPSGGTQDSAVNHIQNWKRTSHDPDSVNTELIEKS